MRHVIAALAALAPHTPRAAANQGGTCAMSGARWPLLQRAAANGTGLPTNGGDDAFVVRLDRLVHNAYKLALEGGSRRKNKN